MPQFLREEKIQYKPVSKVVVVALSALLVAVSLTLAYIGKIYLTFGPIRITFENMPILLGGFIFGPFIGGLVGVCSDLLSCVLAANTINPIITVGAFFIGFFAGIFKQYVFKDKSVFSIYFSVMIPHIFGSMLIKSVGLRVYYHFPYSLLFLRIPLYLAIGTLEAYVIYTFLKIKSIQKQLERM
ncbi:MAG TPA: folate family ECF transporter S component [Clostridiales bacterium]|nr:folate family ECF transporter S component [Clostridiales bacterium]